MTREEKKELLKIARQRITDAGNKGKKKRYHVKVDGLFKRHSGCVLGD